MTSELHEDNDSGYLLVKRNGEVIAKYPIDKLKELVTNFKDICLTSEFKNYTCLDDFIYSIYFLEFLEYFLFYLHMLYPEVSPYIKNYTKMTHDSSFIMNTSAFRKLIGFAYYYLYYGNDLHIIHKDVKIELDKIINTTVLKGKVRKILIKLYDSFLYFLELLNNRPTDTDLPMDLFILLKKKVSEGKLNKTLQTFNQSTLSTIYNLFTNETMLEYRKDLLSKFRLLQRKYLSAIAKLRKIGPPSASPEESKKIKKELNKNKNVDYKAYEIYCKYVLSKEENEDIYDFLAGIHKNNNGSVIHKNINNNTVANIKANTKKKHHIEYVEKSEKILKIVESKIKEHGDIIDSKTKSQVERIRKLFDSQQFKNMTLSFGNDNASSIGGKIIQDCKTIRIINKEIDKMIKEHMNKEKQVNKKNTVNSKFLSDLLEKHPEIKKEQTLKKQIHKLLLIYHSNKTTNMTNNQRKETDEIAKKLTELLISS